MRAKKRGKYTYLQIVENERINGKVVQRMLYSLGSLDALQESGKLDALLSSGIKFSRNLTVLDAHRRGETDQTHTRRIGAPLLIERLWRETGIGATLRAALADRRFGFPVERAIFVTVLHRLFCPGSDRAAETWMQRYRIDSADSLQLHHLYRAMEWLGTALEGDTPSAPVLPTAASPAATTNQAGRGTPPKMRRIKDEIEEALFLARRDLFTEMTLVFFDTTTLYFDGAGGSELGHRGHSKDHRPDAHQMVVGMVLDNLGNPVCSEMWPGNTADVASLIPVAARLKERFGLERICVVADRGMISAKTIADLEGMQWEYILGARMRKVTEVSQDVLSRAGRFAQIQPERTRKSDPSPLRVKEVLVEGRRYIVCRNDEQLRKDRHDRAAIVASLRENLKRGDKSLVGNKGYRRYLKSNGAHFEIDEEKIIDEEQYDGTWVLRTNTTLPTADVARTYKQLWMVEDIFRTMKSILETRPIYHQKNETIVGHVFCSFLAVLLRKALQDRIESKGWKLEWNDIIADVDAVEEVNVRHSNAEFCIRTETAGVAGKVFQAAGISLPPVIRIGPDKA